MKTIIIILGAARSGSTLLGKSIGGHSKCFTLGEINRFNEEINNSETHCGCAEKLSDCNFWNGVLSSLKNKEKNEIKGENSQFQMGLFGSLTKKSKILKLIATVVFKWKYQDKAVNSKIENTLFLYKTVFDLTNSNVLIDTSKGLFRALVLASRRNNDMKFVFIQLTRDGRGVLNSSLKSSYSIVHKDGVSREYQGLENRSPKKVINSWLYINLRNFIILKLLNRRKSIFVQYEDFTANPSKNLKIIFEKVHLKYEVSSLNLGASENHILGGNTSRINAKEIKKQDDAWRKKLNDQLLKKFNKKAGWFNKLIGYK